MAALFIGNSIHQQTMPQIVVLDRLVADANCCGGRQKDEATGMSDGHSRCFGKNHHWILWTGVCKPICACQMTAQIKILLFVIAHQSMFETRGLKPIYCIINATGDMRMARLKWQQIITVKLLSSTGYVRPAIDRAHSTLFIQIRPLPRTMSQQGSLTIQFLLF